MRIREKSCEEGKKQEQGSREEKRRWTGLEHKYRLGLLYNSAYKVVHTSIANAFQLQFDSLITSKKRKEIITQPRLINGYARN